MNKIQNPVVGDKVGYNNVNLMSYRGEIKSLNRGKRGGDCIVKWEQGWPEFAPIESEECLFNLRRL